MAEETKPYTMVHSQDITYVNHFITSFICNQYLNSVKAHITPRNLINQHVNYQKNFIEIISHCEYHFQTRRYTTKTVTSLHQSPFPSKSPGNSWRKVARRRDKKYNSMQPLKKWFSRSHSQRNFIIWHLNTILQFILQGEDVDLSAVSNFQGNL